MRECSRSCRRRAVTPTCRTAEWSSPPSWQRSKGATEEGRAGIAVSPGPLDGAGDPDACPDRDLGLRLARDQPERWPVERHPVARARDAERLAELPRAGAERPLAVEPAARAHRIEAVGGRERADERGL